MKKYILFLGLTGCTTVVPLQEPFPEVPKELIIACSNLNLIPQNTTKLSEILSVVSDNYALYQECQLKSQSWVNWYNTQKQLHDQLQKGKINDT